MSTSTRANTIRRWSPAGVAALAAATALGLAAPGSSGVEVGQSVSYSFRAPLVNGKGAKSLEDFRGRPVLVEFWGTR